MKVTGSITEFKGKRTPKSVRGNGRECIMERLGNKMKEVGGAIGMNEIVNTKRDALGELCLRYHVKSLEVFGSATDDTFDGQTSDLDFLVVFEPCSPSEHYDRYFGLLESLEALFERSVDLVEASAMRNPYFIRSVNQTRTPVYAA